jgi:hypothetical protein
VSGQSRNWRWWIYAVVAVPLGLIVYVVGGVVVEVATRPSMDDLVETADEFVPPSEWQLVRHTESNETICIDEPCPRLQRVWSMTDNPVEEVQELAVTAGWFVVRRSASCKSGSVRQVFCTIEIGEERGFTIQLGVDGPPIAEPGPWQVVLNMHA